MCRFRSFLFWGAIIISVFCTFCLIFAIGRLDQPLVLAFGFMAVVFAVLYAGSRDRDN